MQIDYLPLMAFNNITLLRSYQRKKETKEKQKIRISQINKTWLFKSLTIIFVLLDEALGNGVKLN